MTKRLISLLLTVVMVFSSLIMPALAADMEEPLPEDEIFEVEVPAEGEENDPADAPEEPADSEGDQDKEEVPPQNEDNVDPADDPAGEDVKTPDDEDTNDNAAEQAGAIVAAPENADKAEEPDKTWPVTSMNGITVYAGSSDPIDIGNIISGGRYLTNVRAMLTEVNNFRTSNSLGTLQYDYAMEQVAMTRAAEMIENYGHERPGTAGNFTTCHYNKYYTFGEIYYRSSSYLSVHDVFVNWYSNATMYQYDLDYLKNSGFYSMGAAGFQYGDYYYWVIEFSHQISGVTDPYVGVFDPSPDNLLAGPTITTLTELTNGIQIQWDAVAGINKFRIYYKVTGTTGWSKVADVTSKSYTWTGAKAGTNYTFTVRGINSDGSAYTSVVGNEKSISYKVNAVDTPVLNNPVIAATGGITISWQPVLGGARYRIFYKVAGASSWSKLTDTVETSYTWTGAKGGTTYYFTVRCVSADGQMYTSDYDKVGVYITYIAPVVMVNTPHITSLTNTGNGIVVTWNSVKNAVRYRVFVKKEGDTGWKTFDTTSTSYTWTGAVEGKTTYVFCVRCVSADGQNYASNPSEESSILYTNLSTPQITSVKNISNGVVINWNAVSGADMYRIFYKVGSGGWTALTDIAAPATSFTWTGGKVGTIYTFTIRCVTANGKSYTSAYDQTGVSVTYGQLSTLKTPAGLKATADANGITISWGAVTGAAKYRIFYRINGTASWSKLVDTTATSYTWTGPAVGTTYDFTVRCINADASMYTSDYDKTGTTCSFNPTLLSNPTLKATNAANGVTLTWTDVGAAKYRVFFKIGDSNWTQIADTTACSYTWTGAVSGTWYSFRVLCVSADGKRYTDDPSSAKDVKDFQYNPTNDMPVISSAVSSASGITLEWNAVPGAAMYRIFYKVGNTWTKLADTSKTSYTWTGAVKGTTYIFTVRCMSADSKSYTSDYDKTGKTVTHNATLATPKITTVSNSADGLLIEWGAVSGAVMYRVFYKIGTSWVLVGDTTQTSLNWTGAVGGTTYTFTVRCISADKTQYTSDYDKTGFTFTKSK